MNFFYADNSATSYPKPMEVVDSITNYLVNIGTNIGRGSYKRAVSASNTVYETRELLCELFNFDEPMNVVFTSNITESLNIVIKGFLNAGDHVLVSSMEHNAVMRTLSSLSKSGVEYTIVKCCKEGFIDKQDLINNIKTTTKLILVNHVSNVSGSIQNIEEISQIAAEHHISFIIDSAQSAGILPIDFKRLKLAALPFTGHKGLMGPEGTGGLLLTNDMAQTLTPLILGGTGSDSSNIYQPEVMPDKFESGTLNIPGIFGLNAALKYINKEGLDNILYHELELGKLFLNNILNIPNISIHGTTDMHKRLSVFSITFKNIDNSEAAYILDKDYNIMTRCGLHCSPLAHKTLGTYPGGTIRFSFGYFNTKKDIDYISNCLLKLANRTN